MQGLVTLKGKIDFNSEKGNQISIITKKIATQG